jgi:hypothetical protein
LFALLTEIRSRYADEWMAFLENSVHKHIEKPPKYLRDARAVRIAVLDTGIDKEHPFIRAALKEKRIRMTESFVSGVDCTKDTFGHGTYIASLLLTVAPDAQLYVAKIATSEDIPPDHRIGEVTLTVFAWN